MINESTRAMKEFLTSIGTDEYLYIMITAPLTQRQKEALTLLYRDGLSVTEVADKMRVGYDNVQYLRKKAIKKLEHFLKTTKNPYITKIKTDNYNNLPVISE